MTNATITGANPSNTSYSGGNLTMFLNVTFSGIQTIGKVYNGSDCPASCASATKCSFYHVIATGDLLAGFGLTGRDELPTGQDIFTISSVATNQSATVQNYTVSTIQASSNLAPHQAFGQFSSPLGTWSAGTLTIAGNYSGTYLTGATVTVFNASKGVVFSDGVFSAAPNREYAFAVAWTVTLAGTYGLVLTLTEQWGATLNFTVNTTVTAATPSSHTYSNSTWGIDGLGPGGSAAVIITIGIVIGIIVMALVGRGLWGGAPTAAAQPWSGQKPATAGAGRHLRMPHLPPIVPERGRAAGAREVAARRHDVGHALRAGTSPTPSPSLFSLSRAPVDAPVREGPGPRPIPHLEERSRRNVRRQARTSAPTLARPDGADQKVGDAVHLLRSEPQPGDLRRPEPTDEVGDQSLFLPTARGGGRDRTPQRRVSSAPSSRSWWDRVKPWSAATSGTARWKSA